MTIEKKEYSIIDDISTGDENFKISKAIGLGLSALSCVKKRKANIQSEKACLVSLLISDNITLFSGFECWIYSCDTYVSKTWRFKKKSVDNKHFEMISPDFFFDNQREVENKEKGEVRVYNSFLLPIDSLSKLKITEIYETFSHVHFLFLRKSDEITRRELIDCDWLDNFSSSIYENRFSQKIFPYLLKGNGIEVAVMGEFDDADLVGLLIGNKELLNVVYTPHWSNVVNE